MVFPTIVKAEGFGFGGEYGEGSLLIHGRPAEYYDTVSASFGFQLGAQAESVIIMFMTPDALEGFRIKDGWKVGVDGSVAIIAVGAGGADTNYHTQPDRRLHLRSEGVDVQSDTRRLEDQPHLPLTYLPLAAKPSAGGFGWSITRSSYKIL